jgi:hypothetical protein
LRHWNVWSAERWVTAHHDDLSVRVATRPAIRERVPHVLVEHSCDMRHALGKSIGTLGVVSGRSGRPTGTLPARLGPKIAFAEGLLEARNGFFHRRINDLQRFDRPAY